MATAQRYTKNEPVKMEVVPCNLCGSEDPTTILFTRDESLKTDSYFEVVKCGHCGLIYLNPRPAREEIHKFYSKDLLSMQLEFLPEDQQQNCSLSERFLLKFTKNIMKSRFNFLKANMDTPEGLSLLNVEWGKDNFQPFLQAHANWKTQGTNFSFNNVSHSHQGQTVRPLSLELNKLGLEKPVDLVTVWEYLEHSYNPYQALLQAHAVLSQEGHLAVEVPNVTCLENKVFGKKSYLYDSPRNLYHFSPQTMKSLLKKAGFEIVKMDFSTGSGGWIGSIQRYLLKDKVIKDLKNHVPFLLAMGAVTTPIKMAEKLFNTGSNIRVLAKKRLPEADAETKTHSHNQNIES